MFKHHFVQPYFVVLFISASLGCQYFKSSNATAASGSSSASTSSPGSGKSEAPKPRYLPQFNPEDKEALHPRGLDLNATLSTIAFGSCANQDAPQPLWNEILKNDPQLFLFMGDNIYASKAEQKPASEQYKKLNKIPEYKKARESIPFMATWDDHDYGVNDGGANNPDKIQAQKDFSNYWRYIKDSIPLNQEGIYHSKLLGPNKKTVLVIMLDTRYFRSPLVPANDPNNPKLKYLPNKDKKSTLLGEKQWQWLEAQLRRKADLTIVVSSIQMLAETPGFEKWGNFPHEKERFFNTLKKTRAKNVFIFSGDRHIGFMSEEKINGWGTLYEVSSSSINRPTDLSEEDPAYLFPIYNQENFALMKIDWQTHKIFFELRNSKNSVVHSLAVPGKF
ncbi:MAG: alkaline phosphatase D family protein [Pseudobdellovibrionaceae bacterium]